MGKKGLLAKKYFECGYNCAQAVAMAFEEYTNFDKETLAAMTLGFGGGMGRMREVCGSFSGMVLIISLIYGSGTADGENKKKVYKIIQELAEEFKKENGSIVCRELLGLRENEHGGDPEKRTQNYYKKRPCVQIVAGAADILENYLTSRE